MRAKRPAETVAAKGGEDVQKVASAEESRSGEGSKQDMAAEVKADGVKRDVVNCGDQFQHVKSIAGPQTSQQP